MELDHIGIINKSEEDAMHFYAGLLALEKKRESILPPELSQQLFSLAMEIKMLAFGNGTLRIEVFLIPGFVSPFPRIPHFCIQVHDFPGFLASVREAGAKVIIGKRPDKAVYFVEDFSGNRIELKSF
ncbi:MAG TPA: VOC family protein [Thermodesulfovibrionales bacterium]|nr:VOC family protein [Thermodesulfovibrionales bacterium]